MTCYGLDDACCVCDDRCVKGDGDCDADNQCESGTTCGNANCDTSKCYSWTDIFGICEQSSLFGTQFLRTIEDFIYFSPQKVHGE